MAVYVVGAGDAKALTDEPSLFLTTEDAPPGNMVNPTKGTPAADEPPATGSRATGAEIIGISTDMLRYALDRAKIKYSVAMYPWRRAYNMALNNPNTCVYSTIRTGEREESFKWIGPIIYDDWVVFARADNPSAISSIADLKGHAVGVARGDAEALFLRSEGIAVDEVTDDQLNPRKLSSGRVEFWATARLKGMYFAARAGIGGLKEVLWIRRFPVYLACNKSVPEKTVAALNKAINELVEEGTAARIVSHYQAYLAGSSPDLFHGASPNP